MCSGCCVRISVQSTKSFTSDCSFNRPQLTISRSSFSKPPPTGSANLIHTLIYLSTRMKIRKTILCPISSIPCASCRWLRRGSRSAVVKCKAISFSDRMEPWIWSQQRVEECDICFKASICGQAGKYWKWNFNLLLPPIPLSERRKGICFKRGNTVLAE